MDPTTFSLAPAQSAASVDGELRASRDDAWRQLQLTDPDHEAQVRSTPTAESANLILRAHRHRLEAETRGRIRLGPVQSGHRDNRRRMVTPDAGARGRRRVAGHMMVLGAKPRILDAMVWPNARAWRP